jgi:hypothetical protein
MQMKKVLVIILTALMFCATVFIGVANVYRVSGVTLDVNTVSDVAKEEAKLLQEELAEVYLGESTLFATDTLACEVVEKYPYFRLTKFEKQNPDVLRIEVTEDVESFAVQVEGGYMILSQTGTVLDIREDSKNRADGEENIIVVGGNPVGEICDTVSGAGFAALLKMCSIMSESLNGVRSNVERIVFKNVEEDGYVSLQMREGVKINIVRPHVLTEAKAEAFTKVYLALEDEQRLTGFIHATENSAGTDAFVKYEPNNLS